MEATHGYRHIISAYYFKFYKKHDDRIHRWAINGNLVGNAREAKDKLIDIFGDDIDIVKFYVKRVIEEYDYFIGRDDY